MQAGLWGLSVSKNRSLAKQIYQTLLNKEIMRPYNNKMYLEDQFFLTAYVWPTAKLNSTVHDSYFCNDYGGIYFPTKRENTNCFVSCSNCCLNKTKLMKVGYISRESVGKECPLSCRKQKEWNFC